MNHFTKMWLIVIAVFCFKISHAQTNQIDLSPLVSTIGTGLLSDLSNAPTLIRAYSSGATPKSSNQRDYYEMLHQIEIMSAKTIDLPNLDTLMSLYRNYENRHLTPISIINYSYDYFPDDNIFKTLVSGDSIAQKVWYNFDPKPFLKTDTLKLAYTPIRSSEFTKTFIIPSDLYFGNIDVMQSYEIDFGDGNGFRPVTLNKEITIEYPDLEDSFQHFDIRIKCTELASSNGPTPMIKAAQLLEKGHLPDLIYDVRDLPLRTCGEKDISEGDARISVRFGVDNADSRTLRHPIVFIEGFDLDTDGFDKRYGDVTWNTLMTGLAFNESGEQVRKSLLDLKHLSQKIYQENYDLIFINFRDATRNIYENGQTVIRVLQWVESIKEGDDGISVFGASLGGLLSRYAIRQMEINDCNPCVKLNCAFDSPHQGANLPLGVQHAVDFLKSESANAYLGYLSLSRTAAQQALIYNIIPGSQAKRNDWQRWLDQNGHPKTCKNVAITNGSPSGLNGAFDPAELYYDFRQVAGGSVVASLRLKAIPDCQQKEHCSTRIFDGYIPTGNSDLGKYLNGFLGISCKKSLVYFSDDLPLDNCSGGMSAWAGVLDDMILNYFQSVAGKSHFSSKNRRETTFVPTYSSLDMAKTLSHPPIQDMFPKDKLSSGHPFDEIFYHSYDNFHNQLHVYFDNETGHNIDWIMEQLSKTSIKHPRIIAKTAGANSYNMQGEQWEQYLGYTKLSKGSHMKLNSPQIQGYGSLECDSTDYCLPQSKFSTMNCSNGILVDTNAVLELGEHLCPNTTPVAHLRITSSNILEIKPGGAVIINDSSSLKIEKNASLVLHKGAEIILNGSSSSLNIEGRIILLEGAKFQPTVHKNNKFGQIEFIANESGNFESYGSNEIQFNGLTSDKKLRIIVKNGELVFPSNLEEISFNNIEVILDATSAISLSSKAKIENSNILGEFKSPGIFVKGGGKVDVKSVVFKDLFSGLTQTTDSSSLVVENSFFNSCESGFISSNGNFQLKNSSFQNNVTGLLINYLDTSLVYSCAFKSNSIGIQVRGGELSKLRVENSILENNQNSIWIGKNLTVELECNSFKHNDIAIFSEENSKLLMGVDPFSQQLNAGGNSFYKNGKSIELFEAHVYIKNGKNNFEQNTLVPTYKYFVGSIKTGSNCLNSSFEIDVANNYWYPSIPDKNLRSAVKYYNLNTATSPHRSKVYLAGSQLQSYNSECVEKERNEDNNKGKETIIGEKHDLRMYPNPSSGVIHFVGSESLNGEFTMNIFSSKGEKLCTQKVLLSEGVGTVVIRKKLPETLYLVEMQGKSDLSRSILFIEN